MYGQALLKVSSVLNMEYDSIYGVDLDSDTTIAYKISDFMTQTAGIELFKILPYSRMLKYQVSRYVSEGEEQFELLLDIPRLIEELKAKSILSFIFKVRKQPEEEERYYEIKIIRSGDFSDDKHEAVVAFRDVHESYMNRYLDSMRKIDAILHAVTDDYICLIDVDLKSKRETIFNLNSETGSSLPRWSDGNDYYTGIKAFADRFIVDEDRARFLKATRLPHLLNVFQTQKEFIIEYDALIENEKRQFQGRFVLGESGEEADADSKDGRTEHMYVGIRDITKTKTIESKSRELMAYERYQNLLRKDLTGKRDRRVILVVEPEETVRKQLREILQEQFIVFETDNGGEAFEILKEQYQRVSMVLLELDDSGMNALEFLEIMKKDPYLRLIPSIVMTEYYGEAVDKTCMKYGASEILAKPLNRYNVLRKTRGIIQLRESAATLAAVEFDSLTGLHSKQAFYYHAENQLKLNQDRDYCLIVSDIVNFRKINENYGYEIGDQVLKTLAAFLAEIGRNDVLTGTLGADHFVSLVESDDIFFRDDAFDVIRNMAVDRMPIKGVQIKFGCYGHVSHELPIAVCCDRVIEAVRKVKHKYGVSVGRYTEETRQQSDRENRLEIDMQAAYDQGQFKVFYQPKHDALTDKLIGAEALIRWEHPEYGLLSPAEFIPIFERTGFAPFADYYVWKRSCKNMRRWIDEGLNVVPVSVNASRIDFSYPDFWKYMEKNLRKQNIRASLMHIEVTESMISDNVEQMIKNIQMLRRAGIQVEMDDFGSGYSSLNTLSDIPIDVVKLDRSFMKEIQNPRRTIVLSACINLAKRLNLKTIAEGVETTEQLAIVKAFGVDAVQGYYYSKPLPEEEFEEYLRKS